MAERDLNRAIINAAGELRSGDPLPDTVPITESGPVLNGALLEGLPGPCVPIPQPTDNALLIQSTSCSNARSFRSFELINNVTADYLSSPGSGRRYAVWATTVNVVRNAPFRVFFDFTHSSINGAGVSIVQSRRPLFSQEQPSDGIATTVSGGTNTVQAAGVGTNGTVRAFETDSANRDNVRFLYAGGTFTQAGLINVSNVAKWDITNQRWLKMGEGLPSTVRSLRLTPQGLYAGGDFGIRRYNQRTDSWQNIVSLSSGDQILAMEYSETSERLYFVGKFGRIEDNFGNINNNTTFRSFGYYHHSTGISTTLAGVSGGTAQIDDLEIDYDGNVFLVGDFTSANGVSTSQGIIKFNPSGSGTYTNVDGIPGFTTGWRATCVKRNQDSLWVAGTSTNDYTTITTTEIDEFDDSPVFTPTRVGTESGWTHVTITWDGSLAIRNGQLFGWGRNHLAQLGDGTTTERTSPTRIGTHSDWSWISSRASHTLGIRANGELYAWGSNRNGRTGLGFAPPAGTFLDESLTLSPTRVGTESDWTQVSAGFDHSAGIRNGQLWTWGANDKGQLGTGFQITERTSPVRIGTQSDWTWVSAGSRTTFGIRNGELYAWGEHGSGRTGIGFFTGFILAPTRVGTESGWTQVSTNLAHTLGIRNGELYAWGWNEYGQLGDGTSGGLASKSRPVRIGTHSDWTWVSAGRLHSLGIRNGELYAWGFNGTGRLGDGTTTDRLSPVRIGSESDWTQVIAGESHSLGIRNSELFAWGSNRNGQSVGFTSLTVTNEEDAAFFSRFGNGVNDKTGFMAKYNNGNWTPAIGDTTVDAAGPTPGVMHSVMTNAPIQTLERSRGFFIDRNTNQQVIPERLYVGGNFTAAYTLSDSLSSFASTVANIFEFTDPNGRAIFGTNIRPVLPASSNIRQLTPQDSVLAISAEKSFFIGGSINAVRNPTSSLLVANIAGLQNQQWTQLKSGIPEAEPVNQTELASRFSAWFEESGTIRLRDTRSDGSEITTNGNQIGKYGVDAWSQGQPLFSRPVQQLFFGSDQDADQLVLSEDFFVGLQDPTPVQGQSLLPIYSNRDELRVSGYGFIQTNVNCSLGEYVTVFVIADTTVEQPSQVPISWQAVVDYEKLNVAQTDTAGDCEEQILNAPSRAYQQGGVVSEWVGGTQFGYFGQTQRDGETVGAPGAPLSQTAVIPNQRFVDNIYFPYEAPPVDYVESIINGLNANNPGANLQQGYFREPSRWAGATGVLPNVRQAPRLIQGIDGIFSMPTSNRTVEIKGYFRAPVTGTYEFYGAASDGLWVWVSSADADSTTPGINRWGVDDLGIRWNGITEQAQSGGESFVEDGFSTGTGRNYGRNNYVLRVGTRTAGTSTQVQSNGIRITLKEGSYYFVRILSGTALSSGFFRLEYQVTAPGGNIVRDAIIFSGRSCQGDSGPAYREPGTGGGTGGGSTFVGPGPGGGFIGGGGGGGGFGVNPYTIAPWWWEFAVDLTRPRGRVTIRDVE